MKNLNYLLKLLMVVLISHEFLFSLPFRVTQLPNGSKYSCANCHIDPAGGGDRNPFGTTVETQFLDLYGNVLWGPGLAKLDSDKDGFTNGEELQDPNGKWRPGDAAPGNISLVSKPGDSKDIPKNINFSKLTIHFTNFTPHVGQKLELRVFDKMKNMEVGRITQNSVPAAEFYISLNVLELGHSYFIDFYADLNKNGIYDPPPSDHAWRLQLDNVVSDTTIDFMHNTNFTDIDWTYLFTLNLQRMTPHVGQKIELRLVDKGTNLEIGRIKTIADTNFSMSIPGIRIGKSYWVDFYADLNKNGVYDKPPSDHAWRMELNNVTGDASLTFTHNTNFTDIQWPYMLTMFFTNMSPHLNQLLELRVIDKTSNSEIGRVKQTVLIPNFQINFPGVFIGGNYRIDFYADLNKNGRYDPPPADHAWRVEYINTSGDTTINFKHNTTFTDVNWPYLFTLNFKNMTPHLNQLFELRLIDKIAGTDVGYAKINSIAVPNFSISVPGIMIGGNYRVDFYADLNNNKKYDPPPTDHAWRLEFQDSTGDATLNFTHNTNFTDINWPVVSAVKTLPNKNIPEKITLSQNYPNPFNPTTRIEYTLPANDFVRIKIYNLLGQEIETLVNSYQPAGAYSVEWIPKNLTSGIYYYKLQTRDYSETKKLIFQK